MEDTIEICSGCGKMPRAIDKTSGEFTCSRCGNRATINVTANDYEKTATDLDAKFQQIIQKNRIEAALSAPVELKPKPKKSVAKKSKTKSRK